MYKLYAKFSKIVIDETEEGTAIYLKEATEGRLQEIIIASYDKNVEIINDYEDTEEITTVLTLEDGKDTPYFAEKIDDITKFQ